MIYGSVCSGIEAATVAWKPLGWEASFYSEIDKNPRKVLQHHYSDTPLHGDFTTIQKGFYNDVDLLAGGTPCQSFSVAGKRKGMDDPRGQLSMEYAALADRLGARWVVWENVPGVLSSDNGRDFKRFIESLVERGYGVTWRVLDSQNFGVPQRRRRVVLVGYRGDWRRSFAALFDRESLQWNPATRREKRGEIVGTLTTRTGNSRDNFSAECGHLIATEKPRWLTAVECERLMGFPDNYTNVPGISYWKRHAMLGNSWVVPVFQWLGARIEFIDGLSNG